jgi:hypothetical protein
MLDNYLATGTTQQLDVLKEKISKKLGTHWLINMNKICFTT